MTEDAVKVRLSGVSKAYGLVKALETVNLDIARGEFVTLLGPSGSGKTTLLNIVAGMAYPTEGRVFIAGKDVTEVPPNKRELGMVFQHYALMPHMSIFENVAFPLRVRRVPKAELARRVDEALKVVRMPHLAQRMPSELSGGQQQRVAIARCLVYGPSIILMDEPLGALDKKLREEMQLELKRLHAELGITILYVTHDQEEALTMSDRIILMNGGRIEQIGTPDDLYFRPRTRFSATFLGDSNLLEGNVVGTGAEVVVETPVGRVHCIAPMHQVAVGDAVQILLRPENVRLVDAEGADHTNVFKGQMINDIAYGGVTKSFVQLGESRFVSQELTTSARKVRGYGEDVALTWSATDAIILPPPVTA